MAKKTKPSVIRKIASSKQTGGGGFVFEDKVSAWFIAHFLADRYPFIPEIGKIKRIDYQVRADGWLLEDLLLTTEVSDNIDIKIPISSKSYVQINSKGPNSELLGDIWNEYLNIVANVFDTSKDYLCIINSKLHPKISKDLNSLIKFSKENDAKSLHQRINQDDKAFSKDLKKLYKGFYCPPNIAKTHNIDESETVKILSRIILVEFDFENAISNNENQIIEFCKNCLLDPSNNKEQQLYKNLCSLRGELAPLSGFLDYQKLIKKLKNHFQLKGFSNHNSDWNKILEISRFKIDSIQDKIGNKVSFSTLTELEEIQGLIEKNKAVFILGKSGYGKSVLAKKYIQEKLKPNDKFLWVDAQSIQNSKLENYFGVQHNLTDIFNKAQQSNCYLFIDGIDRFFKEIDLNMIYPILSAANKPSSSWKLIFTCQIDDYEDVLERLYRINITLDVGYFEVKANTSKDISQLKSLFPELYELFKHSHLTPILNNLKYLDLLAYNLSKNTKLTETDYIGESTIIDWIWNKEIESIGSSSTRFIQDFSEKQAQKLSISIPVSDFSISDIQPLDKLKQSKIFVEIKDRLYLTHDLFGDWARYKLIRGNKVNLKSFLLSKDLFSPLWCKAIKLYGIYLLESNKDCSEWIELFNSLSSLEPKEKIIQDLILESIIFSANTFSHLEALWDFFKQNEGNLFNRFLDQFLLKATLPNKNILKLAKEVGGYSISEASSYDRIPNHLYWGDVLGFLYIKKNELIKISRLKIASITKMWLEYTPLNFLYRKECSEIALDNAKWIFEFKLNGGYVKGEADNKIYKAFLMGVNENPEGALDLALKLCKRIRVEKQEKKRIKEANPKGHKSIFSQAIIRDKVQWTDGPFERVDNAFEKICIDENALNPVIDSHPIKAKEILLALFIEPPKEISFGYDHNYDLDINEPHGWFPPFYTRGPFLYFLNHQSKIGIEFIVSLINFATEHWTNVFKQKQLKIPKLSLKYKGQTKTFIGDERVYFWFRDATGAPHSIVSALMALEKFIYNQIDSEKPVTDFIDLILKKGNSVAYLGVLNAAGKYSSKLYLNELKPLLQSYEFYEWESSLDYGAHSIEGHQMIGSNSFSESIWKLAKEWHEMPQRKISIQAVSLTLFLHNKDLRKYYRTITKSWKSSLNKIESEGYEDVYLNKLITFYNYDNYELLKHEDNFYYQYKEHEKLTTKYKDVREELAKNNDDFTFPFWCFQELKKDKKYSLNDCINIWNKIEIYAKRDDEYPYDNLSGKYQYVLGGAAILVFNKIVWIDKYPDILKWIVEYVDEVLINYSLDIYHISQAETGHSWQQFTANILTRLWTTDLDNKKLKNQIALLLTKAHYDTIKTLFYLISKHLKWSDKNFIQLQNSVIIWSSILYKDQIQSKNYNSTETIEESISEKSNLSLDDQREQLVKDFENNKLKDTLLDWSNLRIVETKIKRRYRHHEDKTSLGNKPGIDLEMLHHAFISIPVIVKADNIERNHLLNVWKQVTNQLVFELGDVNDNTIQQEDYPSQFHLWALKGISELITHIKPTDDIKVDFFWKCILHYGYFASHWVNNFCLHYFLTNIENKENHENFFFQWNQMIIYANETKTWEYKRHYRENELWESLMGVSSSMFKLWDNPDYKDFFKKVIQEDIKIIAKKSYDQDIIYLLLKILKTPPGLSVLKVGIVIINTFLDRKKILDSLETPEGLVKIEFKYEDTLAKTISFLWENHKNEIRNHVLTLNGFKQIVLYLVAKQNSIGFELQNRILMY